MVSTGAYVAGVLELAVVLGSLGYAATRLRARLLPVWDGAPARLAEAVLGIALGVWVGELLGVLGLLREGSLVGVCALVGLGSTQLARPTRGRDAPPAPAVEPLALLIAVAVVGLLFAHWGLQTKVSLNNGVSNFDSLWYHLPYATDIAQGGSVTGFHHTETVFLNWFYPQNSELIHASGMLIWDRDTLSLFVNLGWLALTLLAAWCVGRPWGRGPHCIVAAALVLEAHTLIFREPGSAKNDVVAAALVLCCVALLVSGWAASRAASTASGRDPRGAGGTSLDPMVLAIAGLAAGLAVGTKFTVLATVAALTAAVIALAPRGTRVRATLTWFVPLLAGGAFWYLRNLIAVGNPLPQVRHLGPLALPGPERLQTARPDFPVLHYATDTAVWRQYFGPGLHEAFGTLWPLVVLAGVAGAILVIARRGYPLLQLLGAAAIFGLVAYLATPLSAAGEQGAPVAFSINIRFALPALVIGLVLLPLGRGLQGRRAGWALLLGLLVVLVATNRSWAVVRQPERAFGVLVALLAVAVPALLLWLRSRGVIGTPGLAAALAALAALVAVIGYPVQRDYLRDRWRDFDTGQHLDTAYRWAADERDRRIGLAGTTTGFLGYGFYGKDLSNRVEYLGREGPHGSFNAIRTCRDFRRAVNEAELDYLVTGPFLNFAHQSKPKFSPEARWIEGDPAVSPVNSDGAGVSRVTVWKLDGPLDPDGCAGVRPQAYLPT